MVYFCHARIPDQVIKPAAVEAARPFKDEKKSVACSCTESDGSEEEERSEEEDNVVENPAALRVTTRANFPYNLEGYARNAMLMLSRATQHHRTYEDICEKMIRVTQVFDNFRFEVIQHENLTDDQIDQTCQDFFGRDFNDYGCVAVVLFKADCYQFEDSVIVRHCDANPTLQGKPKLFINEGEFRSAPNSQSLITGDQADMLYLHLPSNPMSPTYVNATQPLHILCNKLTKMANADLLTIIYKACDEIQIRNVPFWAYMCVTSTLTKNLFLERRLG